MEKFQVRWRDTYNKKNYNEEVNAKDLQEALTKIVKKQLEGGRNTNFPGTSNMFLLNACGDKSGCYQLSKKFSDIIDRKRLGLN
jgi:hypothetical protein